MRFILLAEKADIKLNSVYGSQPKGDHVVSPFVLSNGWKGWQRGSGEQDKRQAGKPKSSHKNKTKSSKNRKKKGSMKDKGGK